jgi:hypothetical protein
MFLKLPVCEGHSEYDAWNGDYDFWCDYGEETIPDECDDCLCGWKESGGRVNPKTGRKIPWLIAFLLYGPPSTRTPCCKNCSRVKGKWKHGKAVCFRGWLREGTEVTKEDGFLCSNYEWKHCRTKELKL